MVLVKGGLVLKEKGKEKEKEKEKGKEREKEKGAREVIPKVSVKEKVAASSMFPMGLSSRDIATNAESGGIANCIAPVGRPRIR